MTLLLVIRVLFYVVLGAAFGTLSIGFLSEQRLEALPLGLIFGALALLCFFEVFKALQRCRDV